MRALILAAGIGSRLRPLTDEVPKCMIEVNGIKIIEKQIQNLLENGIKDIAVITGYKSDVLEKYINEKYTNVQIIRNDEYLTTNNMYSLFLGSFFVRNNEFILMNADVFFDSIIIKKLLETSDKNVIVCDKGNYLEESMKIIKKEDRIIEISKKVKENESYGATIDVYKFSKEASEVLLDKINEIININNERNSWTEVAIQEILKEVYFKSLDMNYNWVEIDNNEDLKLAEKIFEN